MCVCGSWGCRETQSAGAAEEEESSDEFPSDEEGNGEEADVESGSEDAISDLDRDYDNDAFIPDSFLWHLEHDSAPESDPLQYHSPFCFPCTRATRHAPRATHHAPRTTHHATRARS